MRKYAVLHCEHFTGKHTGLRLDESLTEMLNKWKIERKKVHVVLRDNDPNMVKATNEANQKMLAAFDIHYGLLFMKLFSASHR